MSVIQKGDKVAIVDEKGKRCLLVIDGSKKKVKGFGILDTGNFIGMEYGRKISIGNKHAWILKPSSYDRWGSIKRRAQIILPKDASTIIVNCSIVPGSVVVEGGIGSGSLTIIMAQIVAPNGKIISYEKRKDFLEFARENILNAGVERFVEIKERDITKGIDEKEVDAVVLDIPNPWDVIDHAWNSLKVGGYFCSYTPLTSQVEKTVKKLRKRKFIEIRTVENIQREIVVLEKGVRPSFQMLGHTGYLTFARKVLD